MAIDKVAEDQGGMMGGHSAGSWPRDVKQAYNLKCNSKPRSTVSGTDPYLALVMQCKEEAKDNKTAYIRKVICAPEPIVILSTEEQLDGMERFCTNGANFGVFSIDPTFDLGAFSVTTTTYEHLNLLSRRSGVNPVMIGPLMIHQKKEKATYNIFADHLLNSRPQLRNLQVVGTDGEVALSSPFLEKCPNLIHLLCFNHFKNNVVHQLKSIGVDESNRKCIVADIFGQQQGARFEEGIVDSEDEEEFLVRLDTLKSVWSERLGSKGLQFHKWFLKHKADAMRKKMLPVVRQKAGLGKPPKPYYSNRVECANSLLSSETDNRESAVDEFVAKMRDLTERQARNVRWAIIDKGPFRLHPSLRHLQLLEETWIVMSKEEKDSYVEMVMLSDVSQFADVEELQSNISEVQRSDDMGDDVLPLLSDAGDVVDSSDAVTEDVTHGLSLLANAALNVLDDYEEPAISEVHRSEELSLITFREFSQYLENQPSETIKGIYEKAVELLQKPNAIVRAPGCDVKARMVESRRLKERPHLVTPGKGKGEYKCEKNCPHYNGIKICSHAVATAQANGELLGFLEWFRQTSSKKTTNLSSVVKTDMPKYPGRKGGVPSTARRSCKKLPIAERVKRTYTAGEVPNTNPFFMKQMNTRIKVCQGCRQSLKSTNGELQPPPYDYCVARQERRPYTDRASGQLRTPSRESDSHYHLRVKCIKAVEPSFICTSLVIPEDLPLTDTHKAYIKEEFQISLDD